MLDNERKSGILLSYFAMIINIVIGIFYTPIMLRMIGQNEYGLFSFATSIIAYMAMLDLGLANTLVRYNVRYRATGNKKVEEQLNGFFLVIYITIGIISLIIGYMIYINAKVLFPKFTTEELNKIKIIIGIMTLNVAVSFPLSVFSSIITAYEKFVFSKTIAILNTVLKHLAILIVLYFGYKSIGMTLMSAATSFMTNIALMIFCIIKLKVKFRFKMPDKALIIEILIYSFFIFMNILIDQLYVNTDKVVIGTIIGTAEVAVYTVAMLFQSYFTQFSTSVNSVFLPRITAMATKEEYSVEISNLFIKVARIQFIILSFIMSGFVLFGKSFITLWAGIEYINSYYIALIVMIPAIIPLSQNLGIIILQAKNKHRFRSIVYLIIAILNVVISIFLAKLYGGIGAAIGTSIATLLGQIITMNWYYYKYINLDIPLYWKQIFSISVISLSISAIGFLLNNLLPGNTVFMLFSKILFYSVIYITVLIKYILNEYEKALIKSLINRLF